MKNTETQPQALLTRMVRRFVAFVLAKIYGVRGSLKPPLGGPHAGPLYPLRHRWWKAMNWLYHWSWLPDRWCAWRTSPTTSSPHDYRAQTVRLARSRERGSHCGCSDLFRVTHDFKEEYYGWKCSKCGCFYPNTAPLGAWLNGETYNGQDS